MSGLVPAEVGQECINMTSKSDQAGMVNFCLVVYGLWILRPLDRETTQKTRNSNLDGLGPFLGTLGVSAKLPFPGRFWETKCRAQP